MSLNAQGNIKQGFSLDDLMNSNSDSEAEFSDGENTFPCPHGSCDYESDTKAGLNAHLSGCPAHRQNRVALVISFLNIFPMIFYLFILACEGATEEDIAAVLITITNGRVGDVKIRDLDTEVATVAGVWKQVMKSTVKNVTSIMSRPPVPGDGAPLSGDTPTHGKGKAGKTRNKGKAAKRTVDPPFPNSTHLNHRDNSANDDDCADGGSIKVKQEADADANQVKVKPEPAVDRDGFPSPGQGLFSNNTTSSAPSSSAASSASSSSASQVGPPKGPLTPTRTTARDQHKRTQRSPTHQNANLLHSPPSGKMMRSDGAPPVDIYKFEVPLDPYAYVKLKFGLYFLQNDCPITGELGHPRAQDLMEKYPYYCKPMKTSLNNYINSWMCACGTLNFMSALSKGCTGTHCFMRNVPVGWRLHHLTNNMTYAEV